MKTEFKPPSPALREIDTYTVDRLKQLNRPFNRKPGKPRLLDASRGHVGPKFDDLTHGDTGHSAVGDINGLVDDGVRSLAGHSLKSVDGSVNRIDTIDEFATLRLVCAEAADVHRSFGTLSEESCDSFSYRLESMVRLIACYPRELLRWPVLFGSEAYKLRDIECFRQPIQRFVFSEKRSVS